MTKYSIKVISIVLSAIIVCGCAFVFIYNRTTKNDLTEETVKYTDVDKQESSVVADNTETNKPASESSESDNSTEVETNKPSSDSSQSDNSIEANEIDIRISKFEEMLNTSTLFFEGNEDFSELSVSRIISEYIACSGTPCGFYEFFSGEEISYAGGNNDEEYRDPKKLFFLSYELDADEVDWILKNVFGRNPNNEKLNDNTYYHGDKVYVLAELGGGPGRIYHVEKYNMIEDGKYELLVRCDLDLGNSKEFLANYRFIASPKNDSEKGYYWRIYSCHQLTD